MPAPDAATAAYAIIVLIPLALITWYVLMYREIGSVGLTGGGLTEDESEA